MAFSSTASIISTDLDNMLRGLYRDNADHAVTGTVSETAMATTTITGGVVGATGGLLIFAAGTLAGTASTKDMRLEYGGTTIATVAHGAATVSDWFFLALMTNTSASAQRWFVLRSTADLLTATFDYTTSAIDTSTNQTLEVTGDLANSGDTITQTIMNVFLVQIQ